MLDRTARLEALNAPRPLNPAQKVWGWFLVLLLVAMVLIFSVTTLANYAYQHGWHDAQRCQQLGAAAPIPDCLP